MNAGERIVPPLGGSGRIDAHLLGITYGLMGGITLSLGGPIVRLLSHETTSWQFLAWRSYSFTLLMFCIAIWRAGSIGGLVRETRKLGWMLPPIAASVSLGQICYILGLINTLVANVTFIVGSAPVFAALAGRIVLGERLTLRGTLCLLAAVGGIGVMFSAGIEVTGLIGNLYAVAAMVTYVVYVILLRLARNADAFVASGFGGLFGVGLAAWFAGGALTIPPADLALALFSGVFQVGAGFAFAILASRYIPAAEVTLLIMTEAILGPLIVWWLIAEAPPAATLVGGCIIIAGVSLFAIFALAEERKRFRAIHNAR